MNTRDHHKHGLRYRLKTHNTQHFLLALAARYHADRAGARVVVVDEVMYMVKHDYQQKGLQEVRDGLRTAQSLHFIRPDIARRAKVTFPDVITY